MGKRALKIIGSVLGLSLLTAVFCLLVIMGNPQRESDAPPADQPVLTAAPVMRAADDASLDALVSAFPAPVLGAAPGSGLTLISAVARDAAFEGGFARVAELTYQAQTDNGAVTVIVQSIYPARAMALVEKADYHISGVSGLALCGIPSVRMESGSAIRLHAQTDDAIYVLTTPRVDGNAMAALVRPLQLLTGEGS